MKLSTWLAALLFATCASAQISDSATEREAARKFGESIATALNERDEKAFSALIDLHGLALRAAKLQGYEGAALERFTAGFEKAGASKVNAAYINKLEQTNGAARFMRVTESRPARALVRLDMGQSGNDYMEFVLETRGGRTRAVDWFQLSTGELLSVSASGIAQMVTSDAGAVGRLLGKERVDQKSLDTMRQAGELQRAGKYAEALAEMGKLPESISQTRLLLTSQASLALMAKNEAAYTRFLAKLAEKYGDDPATAFQLIDHYFTIKDRPRMLKALDTIEKRVGVDGVMMNLRAAAYFTTGDYANTLKYADETIRIEPTLMSGYDTRCSALVHLGKHAEAVKEYREMEERFDIEFTRDVFTDDPAFAKFVASKPFGEWLPK